jgi:hypothetical protein
MPFLKILKKLICCIVAEMDEGVRVVVKLEKEIKKDLPHNKNVDEKLNDVIEVTEKVEEILHGISRI